MMTSFETIARHFASDKGVDLTFKDKCCPCADLKDKKIYLPRTMNEAKLLPTLAALIHEGSHIKHSGKPDQTTREIYNRNQKFFKEPYHMRGQFSLLFNLLEDIRIDHKAFKSYPNAKYLYTKMLEFFGNKKVVDDKCDQVQKFIDLVQQVYVYGVFGTGKEYEQFYHNKPLFDSYIKRYGKKVNEIISSSICANRYEDLADPVNDIWKTIVKFLNIKKQNQKSAKQIKDKAKEALEGAESELEDVTEAKEKTQKQYDKECKKDDRDTDKMDELQNDLSDLRKEEKELKDTINESEEAIKQVKDILKDYDEDEDEDEDSEEGSGDEDSTGDLDKLINSEIGEEESDSFSLNGFGRLNALSKRMKADIVPLFNFESCLQDIFKRLELNKTYTKDLGRVNLAKIHKIFKHEGELNDIFVEDRLKVKYNNKVIFLIDASGSMGGMGSHKNQIVFNCLSNMVNMMEERKDEFNLEYAIYTFSNAGRLGLVKNFDDDIKNNEDLVERYRRNLFGGGTDIVWALEECYRTFEDMGNVKDKRFLICMTDSEIGHMAEETILKEYDARKEKMVFIGINRKGHYYDNSRFYKEILMGRMVNSVNDMEAVLVDSFDRLL
jgi:hypothetical protein